MIWMAVTADEYELPIAVEKSSFALAEKMNVTRSTISIMELRYRKGMIKGERNARPNKFGQPYRVVKVKE